MDCSRVLRACFNALTLALGKKMPSALRAKPTNYDCCVDKRFLTGGQRGLC